MWFPVWNGIGAGDNKGFLWARNVWHRKNENYSGEKHLSTNEGQASIFTQKKRKKQ